MIRWAAIRVQTVSTIDIGYAGETAAAEELVRRGYTVLDRNWRTKWCEIDIIACKDDVIWFVEVKYRATDAFGDGLDYIGPQKLQHMERAANLWTNRHVYDGEYVLGAMSVDGRGTISELIEV